MPLQLIKTCERCRRAAKVLVRVWNPATSRVEGFCARCAAEAQRFD